MFNLGFSELILLGIIALIFIGPQQLPEVARTLGRFLNELKRATSDFQSTFTAGVSNEVQDRWQDRQRPAETAATHPVSDSDVARAAEAAAHDAEFGQHQHTEAEAADTYEPPLPEGQGAVRKPEGSGDGHGGHHS